MTTAISSAIQAAVISHASPMPVRTAHAARIVGTRMKTLNRSARTAPTRRLAIMVVLIGCTHAHRAPKTLTELISSIAHWFTGRAAFDWRAPIATLPLGTCSRDQPVPNPGVGALNAVATSCRKASRSATCNGVAACRMAVSCSSVSQMGALGAP